jgi:hypothetical protein
MTATAAERVVAKVIARAISSSAMSLAPVEVPALVAASEIRTSVFSMRRV